MSRNARIGIGVVIGLVALCLCVCVCGAVALTLFSGVFVNQAMSEDPAEIRAVSAEILDYTLPPGFQETGKVEFLMYRMILIDNGSDGPDRVMISIAEMKVGEVFDDPAYREQFQTQIQKSMNWQPVEWELVEEQTVTLRGQEVKLSIFDEQAAAEGAPRWRTLTTGVFEGKSGSVFISITGPIDGWPQEAVDEFLASIE